MINDRKYLRVLSLVVLALSRTLTQCGFKSRTIFKKVEHFVVAMVTVYIVAKY